MVSPQRRHVMLAGLASIVAPAAFAALLETPGKLVLSGRILSADGKPLAGATIGSGADQTATDADGRFVLTTTTRAYRGVTCDGHPVEGFVSSRRRDIDGTWRAAVGLTLV